MLGVDLLEYCVHDPGGQKNFSIRYRHGRAISNRAIEGLDKMFHARSHVKVHCEKESRVAGKVCKVLSCINHRWNEMLCIALKSFAPEFNEYPLIFIEHKTVLWAIDMELMQ